MWLTVDEAAGLEGVAANSIFRRLYRGRLSFRKNGQLLVPLAELSAEAQEKFRVGSQQSAVSSQQAAANSQHYPEGMRARAEARLRLIIQSPRRGRREWFASLPQRARAEMKSYRAFLRWEKRYKEKGIEGLMDLRGRTKRPKLDEETQRLIAALYLQDYQPHISEVYRQVCLLKKGRGDPAPTYSQVRRYIAQHIPHAPKLLARKGEAAYMNDTTYIERTYDSPPGEVWCADHTQIDVACLSPTNGRPIFPWVTVMMDETSRKIIGWWLDEKPSGRTIAACLRRALLQFSPPKILRVDNGRDFNSKFIAGGQWRFRSHRVALNTETDGILTRLGVSLRPTMVYRGRSKPIERWFLRQKSEALKTLPGYRGGSPKDRPEGLAKTLKDGDLLSMESLRKLLGEWIAFYNASPHEGLKGLKVQRFKGTKVQKSPDQVFDAGGREQRLVHPDTLTLLMMPSEKHLVYRNGVQFLASWYYHPLIENLRREYVLLRYDPAEVDRVALFDLRGAFLCWADRRKKLSHVATQEEVRQAMHEERTLRKSTKQYIGWANEALDREELLSKIIEERRRVGSAHPVSNQPPKRLITPLDAEAREMVIAKELGGSGQQSAISNQQSKDQGPKRRTFLPGAGKYLEEDDE